MEIGDKQDCQSDVRRIDELLGPDIFDSSNADHPLQQSAFIDLMICLRDLLHKTGKMRKTYFLHRRCIAQRLCERRNRRDNGSA